MLVVAALSAACTTADTSRERATLGTDRALAADTARADKVNFRVTGTITAVADGDTLTVRAPGGGRFVIRLSDIDTPETFHARNPVADDRDSKTCEIRCPKAPVSAPGQPFGSAARVSLTALAPAGSLAEAECYEADAYGRLVCHLFVGGRNVNLEQIRRGFAMTPSRNDWVRDPASRRAEAAAKAARLGVWSLPAAMTPDAWRRACWCDARCEGAER
jgi:endonuclease YncB( thermonuclease family)